MVSLLVRYPEIATIYLEPEDDTMKFSFLINSEINEEEFAEFRTVVEDSIEAYFFLGRGRYQQLRLERNSLGSATMIEVIRDVYTLGQEELSLIVAVFRDRFDQLLVSEPGHVLLEEDAVFQEELIQEMLEDLRESRNERNLKAFREEGRVMVFSDAPRPKP